MSISIITKSSEGNHNTSNLTLIVIDLPNVPNFNKINSKDSQYSWIFSKVPSLPMSTITSELYPNGNQILFSLKESKTVVLSKLFVLLSSPVEKYNLVQLLLPTLSRDRLITKQQVVRFLLKYTDMEKVKFGVLRDQIDSLDVGKSTETVTEKFLSGVITILDLYWTEIAELKNATYQRLEEAREIYKNQITLKDVSNKLDDFKKQKFFSMKTDFLFPFIRSVLDMCYVMKDSPKSLYIVFQSLFGLHLVIERVVLNALCQKPHGLASAIFKSCSDLGKVVIGIEYLKTNMYLEWHEMLNTLKDKSGQVKFIVNVKPGIPCSAMRCTRIYKHDYEAIIDKVSVFKDNVRQDSAGYCIEEKIDGERLFMHFWKDLNGILQTIFYSRNKIVQHLYGSHVGDSHGIITKYLNPKDFEGIDSIILDGELVTYDESKNVILGFQDVKRCSELLSKGLKQGKDLSKETLYNKLLCFDVIYFNGKSLQATPLRKRKACLSRIFNQIHCKFMQMHRFNVGYNSNDVRIAMLDVQNKNAEGLVLKHWDSLYFVGSSDEWIKVKPSYIRDFIDDLDVTIIGKEGHNYICSLFGNDAGEKFHGWFVSFCNVRFGLDKFILDQIDYVTKGHWKPYSKNDEIEWAENRMRFGALKPKFWIKPADSVVIKIKAKSLNYNHEADMNRYVLNTTLRHPYCIGVRLDKMYNECDSIRDYEDKILQSENKRRISIQAGNSTIKGRKRETTMEKVVKEVNQNFAISMENKDELFKGITFCVLSDSEMDGKILWKAEINGILKSHGAKIIDQPSHYEGYGMMVISDKHTTAVRTFKKDYNIFKFKWCRDCIKTGSLVRLDPSHCLVVDEEIQALAKLNIDDFGCNFTVKYNAKDIWEMSERYLNHGHGSATIIDTETCNAIGFSLYGKKFAFLPNSKLSAYEKDLKKLEIEIYGGELVDEEYNIDVRLTGRESVEEIEAMLRH